MSLNDSAVQVMGDDKLKVIAAELVTKVRQSVTIDWTLRESARAKIRVLVKRILNKYGYPPDLQDAAVKTVLMQGPSCFVRIGCKTLPLVSEDVLPRRSDLIGVVHGWSDY